MTEDFVSFVLARGVVPCAIVGAISLAPGCHRSGPERSEANEVMHALDLLRAAPDAAKRGPLEGLERVACTSPEICSARDRCAEVYRLLCEGFDRQARVLPRIEELEKAGEAAAPAVVQELSTELNRAEGEVTEARAKLPQCEEAVGAMRRHFGI